MFPAAGWRYAVACTSLLLASCALSRTPDSERCDDVDRRCDRNDAGVIDDGAIDDSSIVDANGVDGVVVVNDGSDGDGGTNDGGIVRDGGGCTVIGPETCNGIDDDCDALVDEGLVKGGDCSLPEGNIVQVATGAEHTCALRDDGTVYCWGNGSVGQIGSFIEGSVIPQRVSSLTYAERIASGRFFSCALRTPGHVACWGQNDWGQLGLSAQAFPQYSAPVAIQESPLATWLGVGLYHACIVNLNHEVECWGWNGYGQLGQPFESSSDFNRRVTLVAGIDDAEEVDGGLDSTCALHANGTVSCWGGNDSGQLGDGTTTGRFAPALVTTRSARPLDHVIALSLGVDHACTVKEGSQRGQGTVVCWGNNSTGAVGNGSTGLPVRFPTGAPIPDAVAVASGYRFSCALRADASVWCWGSNGFGQLGNGTQTDSSVPTQVAGLRARALYVGHGDSHACALRDDDAVACWGRNTFGQLGNRQLSTVPELTPVRVQGL